MKKYTFTLTEDELALIVSALMFSTGSLRFIDKTNKLAGRLVSEMVDQDEDDVTTKEGEE